MIGLHGLEPHIQGQSCRSARPWRETAGPGKVGACSPWRGQHRRTGPEGADGGLPGGRSRLPGNRCLRCSHIIQGHPQEMVSTCVQAALLGSGSRPGGSPRSSKRRKKGCGSQCTPGTWHLVTPARCRCWGRGLLLAAFPTPPPGRLRLRREGGTRSLHKLMGTRNIRQ